MADPKLEKRGYPWRKLTREMRKLKLKNTMKEAKEQEEGRTGHNRRRCVTVRPKRKI